jgi:hypothetical protein
MAVFWDAAPCCLVDTDETTRRNIPEDSHLHTRHRENLKSQHSRCIQAAYTNDITQVN